MLSGQLTDEMEVLHSKRRKESVRPFFTMIRLGLHHRIINCRDVLSEILIASLTVNFLQLVDNKILLDGKYDYPVFRNSVDVFSLGHVSECLSSLSQRHGMWCRDTQLILISRVIHWHHHLGICLLM